MSVVNEWWLIVFSTIDASDWFSGMRYRDFAMVIGLPLKLFDYT